MTTTLPIDGTAIRCTCCNQRRKLAEIDGTAIEIIGGHGNNKHRTEVPIQQILEHVAGTVGYRGVASYLRRVYGTAKKG